MARSNFHQLWDAALLNYGEQLVEQFKQDMSKFIKDQFSDPVVDSVSRLPKNELASLAEALVYLTSLKRRVSPETETVAEPIDVALISKGDGFIWINRKHYFKAELNPQYFMKVFKEAYDERRKTDS